MKFNVPIVSALVRNYFVFYRLAGYKLHLFLLCALFGGVISSFGIALLFPLLSTSQVLEVQDNPLAKFVEGVFTYLSIEMSITNVIVMMLGIFFLQAFLTFLQNVYRVHIKSTLGRDWQEKILSSYGEIEYEYAISKSTGFINNLITQEVSRAVSAFSAFCIMLANLITIFIYVGISLQLSWKVTLGGILAAGLMMASMKSGYRYSKLFSRETSDENAKLNEFLVQIIQNYKYLKSTATFPIMFRKVSSSLSRLVSLQVKLGVIKWILKAILEIAAICMVLLLFYFEVVIQGHGADSILVICWFFFKTINRVNSFNHNWNSFYATEGGLVIVTGAIKTLEKHRERATGKSIQSFSAKIELTNVCFSYSDRKTLDNVNLTIPKNRTIAFVGASGAGKSTLVDLLTGILKPDSGSLVIDGIDYDDVDQNSLRRLFSYVTQDVTIFDDSVANNISLWAQGDEVLIRQRLREAARLAHCSEFLTEDEVGDESRTGDRGVKFSGGQRQRIAIARELFRNPDILILDEATSSLDTTSELLIRRSIDSLKNEKTVIIIAHRLSTIKNSDYIYVLEQGRIVEHGAYDQLIQVTESRFHKMVDAQEL
tara:strand:+ start:1685 stop:3478 length:1794 start_codon:yes stop_codon:yes gene_type:complete